MISYEFIHLFIIKFYDIVKVQTCFNVLFFNFNNTIFTQNMYVLRNLSCITGKINLKSHLVKIITVSKIPL